MAHEVFISYSHEDASVAERVRDHLERNGFSCWIAPRDILEGQDFGAAIAGAIQGCQLMVLVFSFAANTSRQIGRELKLADDANRIVVPLRIGEIPVAGNFAYFLGAAQWIEAIGGPNEEHLQRLDNALRRHLGWGENAGGGSRSAISLPKQNPAGVAKSHGQQKGERGKQGAWRLRPHYVYLVSGLGLLLAAALVWKSGKLVLPAKWRAGTVEVNNGDSQKYVWVPPGSFRMGCSDGDADCSPDEKPAHTVSITKGFWMGQTEVPIGAYTHFYQQTGRVAPAAAPFRQGDDQPVVNVSWHDADAYCNSWAAGRLPTEAEWEYAARAGTMTSRYGDLDTIAWHKGNSNNTTHAVSQKAPNAWGLYDMLGNVWEWCSDWYGAYSANPATDPQGPGSGRQKVGRGGSFVHDSNIVRVSVRGGNPPEVPDSNLGFRCVREVIP
jgi:formylglycine-generating enzyme required for sulfatase activity